MFIPYNLQNYTPNPQHPRQSRPDPGEVPEWIYTAATDVHASHLSKDGTRAYTSRYGQILEAKLDGRDFGAWLPVAALPADAVELS